MVSKTYATRIYEVMRSDVSYSPEDITTITGIELDTVRKIMRLMLKHQLVTGDDLGYRKYTRVKQFQKRQHELFNG